MAHALTSSYGKGLQGLGHSLSGYASCIFVKEVSKADFGDANGCQAIKAVDTRRETSRRNLLMCLEAHEREMQSLDYRYLESQEIDPLPKTT